MKRATEMGPVSSGVQVVLDAPTRIPPADLDAERAVLGAVLMEGADAFGRIADFLQPTDFYTEAHRVVFRTMQGMVERGQPIDLVTLASSLTEAGQLEVVGGPPLLARLAEEGSIAAHLQAYAELVSQAAKRREAIQAGAALIADAFNEQPLDVLHRRIAGLAERLEHQVVRAAYDPEEDWRELVDRWKRRPIRLGFRAWDLLIGGLDPGTCIVFAARTSHGKTAMAGELALRLAAAGLTVDVLSLEEPREAITRRMVANLSGVPTIRLKDGTVTDEEFRDAERAVEALQALPLRVLGLNAIRSLTENAVVSAVIASKAQIVIVDHLQQISTQDDNRAYGIERVLTAMAAAALRDRKVLLAAAQLGRSVDERRSAPYLSDISDSSAIEKKARQVWLLYWPCKHKADRSPSDYEVHVAKNSDGGTGTVDLRYEFTCGRFRDQEDAA